MKTHVFEIELEIVGPLLTRSLNAAAVGLDAHGLLDDGHPALAGDHVRGHLLQALDGAAALLGEEDPEVGRNGRIRALLGSASAADSDDAPLRRRLRFPHRFIAADASAAGRRLHRIRLDEDGRVEDGMLLVLHSPLAPGQRARFRGELKVADVALAGLAPAALADWLGKLLQLIPAVGSSKGVGFGAVESVKVSHRLAAESVALKPPALPPANGSSAAQRVGLVFRLDRPFCFAKPALHDNNRFESQAYVPGSALLGALLNHAHAHREAPDCALILELQDRLRFTHAHPLGDDGGAARELPMPVLQSWVRADDGFYDVALLQAPLLIADRAPAFESDWKYADHCALRESGIRLPVQLHAELVVRTAISRDTNSAVDGQLFAMECRRPGDIDFGCDLLIDAAERGPPLLAALGRLLPQALHSLGKTKAEAHDLRLRAPFASAAPQGLKPGDRILLELHSDAALPLRTAGIPASGGGAALTRAFADVFEPLSANSLRLLRHFSRQRYVGGSYLYRRFWQSLGRGYRPLLLTEAGSVFVFEVTKGAQAEQQLRDWAIAGLPVGDSESATGIPAWQLNPYRRQNGYGEIRVRHLSAQTDARPRLLSSLPEYRA